MSKNETVFRVSAGVKKPGLAGLGQVIQSVQNA
jgi:hypothetical protein